MAPPPKLLLWTGVMAFGVINYHVAKRAAAKPPGERQTIRELVDRRR